MQPKQDVRASLAVLHDSSTMELKLEVLSSVSIRGKKPWPHLGWLQEVSQEASQLDDQFIDTSQSHQAQYGIYLRDKNYICQLSVNTGKLAAVSSLSNVQSQTSLLAHSPNGAHLVGLVSCGDMFIWHKKTNVTETHITPLSNMRTKSPGLDIFAGMVPSTGMHTHTHKSTI